MRLSRKEFERRYPHLAREITDENMDITLKVERPPVDPWRGYVPGVEDYLRRCRSTEEALQVIDYLEKHGRLSNLDAAKYRELLKTKGLKAFGPPKEDDYYYRKAKEYWMKLNKMNPTG